MKELKEYHDDELDSIMNSGIGKKSPLRALDSLKRLRKIRN